MSSLARRLTTAWVALGSTAPIGGLALPRVSPILGVPALAAGAARAQVLPEDELQIALNGYVDSFDVSVIYPSVSVTRRVAPSTSVSGRYLVDAITSASMKSRIPVDGITSATRRASGGKDGAFDELRHELGVGASQVVGESTLSTTVLYGTEHDYTSLTLATSGVLSLARRNTDIQLSVVRSWDDVFPETRSWHRDKDVLTLNAGVTQTLGTRAIAQVEFSHATMEGFLSDAYQVVTIVDPASLAAVRYEPRHPELRIRRAIGVRTNVMVTGGSSVSAGYRYYWDTWGVESSTVHGLYQRHFQDRLLTAGVGLRVYTQTRASFFRPAYTRPERYMSVDSNLDESDSIEYQLRLRVDGSRIRWVPGLDRDGVELEARASYYHRRTAAPNWFSRRATLDALVTSLGVRIRFS